MTKKEGYTVVPNKIIRSDKLSVYEKVLFSVLLSFNGCDNIFPKYETLIKQSGIKRTKLAETIKSLQRKKYIKVVKYSNHKTNTYQILKKGLVRQTACAVREVNGDSSPDEREVVRQTASNNKSINNKSIKDTKSGEQSPPTSAIPYKEIIDFLNAGTGKKFKPTSKSSQRHINARWKEGYRFDDFKQVINNMTSKWLNDPKMCDYLRPETLFGNKFEGYLNSTASFLNKQNDESYPYKALN